MNTHLLPYLIDVPSEKGFRTDFSADTRLAASLAAGTRGKPRLYLACCSDMSPITGSLNICPW